MAENNAKGSGPGPESIEEIMRERSRIDNIITERFRKKRAILFSDVCGSTSYTDTRGDISGRAWIQKHQDIVLPAIERNEGKVLDIMGDGIMASFTDTLSAVKGSVAIQHDLHEFNLKTEPAGRIHVKIGINAGEILMDKDLISGDVVNVASRIESKAGPDQILISKDVYEEIRDNADIICRFHGTFEAKGKAEPLELYRVAWRDDDIVLDPEAKVRAGKDIAAREVRPPTSILHLEVTREENHIRISAYEQTAGEESTVRRYEEVPIPIERIQTRNHDMVEILNQANRKGRISRDILTKLREVGQVFSDELFTPDIKERVRESKAEHLSLSIDDQLVQVPWELLYDGQEFLCQRFSMGRFVKTRQNIQGIKTRLLGRPLKMLLLADPEGDLKGAYQEGIQIRDYLDEYRDFIGVSLRSDNITPDLIREKIRNFDLVHFAGHADYVQQDLSESGWRLSNGTIKAGDITKMAGTATMPALIFSNACQSARTEEWNIKESFQDEIFGLANAFILTGVKHYIGTFWEILDEPGRLFAVEFYKRLLSGLTIGEAIKNARFALIDKYGEETIVWGSYVLYGDPTFNYMDQIKKAEPEPKPEHTHVRSSLPPVETEIRAREEVIDFGEAQVRSKKWTWLAIAAGVLLLLSVLLWGVPGVFKKDTKKYEQAALTYYHEGNFDEALNACKTLEAEDSQIRLGYLIRGDIYFRRGKLDQAEAAYQKAIQAAEGTDLQKANALMGLGRIASIRKKPDEALKYYRSATKAAPNSGTGYLSQAVLLEDRGEYQKALDLFNKARKLAPNDQALAAITRETSQKVSLAQDQERRDRIDRMVKELLETMKSPPLTVPSDGWTSLPLTVWIMDFKTQGYSLQEGGEKLLVSGIEDQLLQHGRVQLVERALLDKLLEELKLGTSRLADRRTALSLGKILAARLILSGRVIYTGPQTQVSTRFIETETGRITAAVSETSGSAVPTAALAEKLSKNLWQELEKLYPLRGKISEVKGGQISLNIGKRIGVEVGQPFKVLDEDVILEITSVQPETSRARITAGERPLTPGLRVEARDSN